MNPSPLPPTASWPLAAVWALAGSGPAMRVGLEIAAAGVLAGAVWWLGRELIRRNRELAEARDWRRRLLEQASVSILEEDFSEIGRRLAALRAAGVTDLRAHLQSHPGLTLELFRLVRITAANRNALDMLGAVDVDDLARKTFALAMKAGPRTFPLELDALWAGRSSLTCETAFHVGPGQRKLCLLQWTVPRREDGPDLTRVLLIFTDLTELRVTEERYRALFDGAVEGVFETSPDGGFRRANPAMARMLGFASPAELLALSPEACRAVYVSASRRAEFMTAIATADVVAEFESEVRRRDGTTIWISENARAVRNDAGRLVTVQGFVTDVTARKRAEAALRESENRYRALFEQAPVIIVEFDSHALQPWFAELRATGVRDIEAYFAEHPEAPAQALAMVPLIGVNEATVRTVGATDRDEVLRRLAEIVTPEEASARLRSVVRLWQGVNHDEGELPLRMLDGRIRWFFFRWWTPQADNEPGYGRMQTALVDITPIREAEEALRASEARYRMLFEHSPVGIIELDYRPVVAWMEQLRAAGVTDLAAHCARHPAELAKALRLVTVAGLNGAAVRLLAAQSQEEVLANTDRLFSVDVLEGRRQAFLAVWSGRNEYKAAGSLPALDGTLRRVHAQWWVPVVDGRPHYARTQLAVLDLTQAKAAERALATERERLRVTLSAMAEGVITTDADGCIHFINEAAVEITGWPAAAALGRRLPEVCALRHERSGETVSLPVPTPEHPADLPPHTALLRPSGQQRLVEGCCATMRDPGGLGVVLVLRDVTERSRLEAELLRASKLESVGLLAGGIAHDFNNLLAIVMGNLALARLDPAVEAAAGRWLREVERGALRARDLTQQLLTFAKGGEPIREAVQLPDLVREAAEFALHGSPVRCAFDLAADLWAADIDRTQVGQVVQNLVINAVQAMPDGGSVRIGARNETVGPGAQPPLAGGRYLRLTFADTGPGIRPEHLGRIFEPYFTTKSGGSGLGLATVYSIAKKHRGHVAVESAAGAGTTFHLWLPAAEEAPARTTPSGSPFAPLRGRVLFMDDEEAIRLMAAELLGRLGLEVVAVGDGAAAVELYRKSRDGGPAFDVVVMDLTVPGGMGGREAMEKLRAIDPQVRAIVSSGYSKDPVLADHRAHGFRGMVPKPYRVSDLAKVLREVLET